MNGMATWHVHLLFPVFVVEPHEGCEMRFREDFLVFQLGVVD